MLKDIHRGLFNFPDGLFQVVLGVLTFAPPSVPPLPSPFAFRRGELVGEGDRSCPSPLLLLGHA